MERPTTVVRAALAVSCVAWAAAIGCSGDDLAPAKGSVKVNGAPAIAGRVVFIPVGGGPPAIGEIDAQGQFTLQTGGSQAGAKIAAHHVVLKDVRCQPKAKAVSYRAAQTTEFHVEAGTDNQIELNVDVKNGWLPIADD